jgi:lysophospholipase L1-like esterase
MMRRSAFILAVGLLLVASGTATGASNRPTEYLALGDSLAFGYSPLVVPTNPANFSGYPDRVAAALRDRLTNAACPGETSSHLIDLAGIDNNCGQWRMFLPLHATYDTTQLAFADAFLRSHPKTQLVTLDIGANDLGALAKSCGGDANVGCIVQRLPAMLATLSANLDTIYGHIRTVDGFKHKLVALTTYARNYGDPVLTGAIAQINAVVADRTLAWGGIVADGFGAFAAASAPYGGDTCAAGLRIVTSASPLVCDDHPSPAGHDLLARAIMTALRPD